jgi:hypothetical protein
MIPLKLPLHNIISFKKNAELKNVFDVELNNVQQVKQYHSLECHFYVYPFSRKLDANSYEFNPFEEYIKDIQKHQKSAYIKIKGAWNELFGILLGLIIVLIFYKFKPDDLLSVQSIVSILGAYFIGKDLWDDIDNLLVKITKKLHLRYQESYYSYKIDRNSTLTHYSNFARVQRYGKRMLLPEKLELIEQHISTTVRMYYLVDDMKRITEDTVHMCSIRFNPESMKYLEDEGLLFGVKFSFNKKYLFLTKSTEVFQTLNKNQRGCLTEKGEWVDNAAYARLTMSIRRLKLFLKKGIVREVQVFKQDM